MKLKSVCVFCGSNNNASPRFLDLATELGKELSQRKIQMVYGGGDVGMMGKAANAMLQNGGEVIGIIPEHLMKREVAHKGVQTLHVVPNMHERKQMMFDLSDGFICLPGGFGTLDEFMEVVTWKVLDLHDKPIVLANLDRFFDSLISWIETANRNGFIYPCSTELYHVVPDIPGIFDYFDSI